MPNDLHRTNINLYSTDVTYLQKHYGHGWTERVREMVHTAVEHRKTIWRIPVDQRGQVAGEISRRYVDNTEVPDAETVRHNARALFKDTLLRPLNDR